MEQKIKMISLDTSEVNWLTYVSQIHTKLQYKMPVPLDILAGEDNKIVYVYDRKSTYELYDRWCKREL